jgi:hypothetical protein
MANDHEEVRTGVLDLDTISGADMLRKVSDMMYEAPPDSEPYIDVSFKNSWGEPCVMRMYLFGGSRGKCTVH